MAGLASYAFTAGGLDAAVVAFAVASAVLIALVFAASLAVSTVEDRTIESIRAQAPTVKRWGGGILVTVGAWLLLLAVFADFFAELFAV